MEEKKRRINNRFEMCTHTYPLPIPSPPHLTSPHSPTPLPTPSPLTLLPLTLLPPPLTLTPVLGPVCSAVDTYTVAPPCPHPDREWLPLATAPALAFMRDKRKSNKIHQNLNTGRMERGRRERGREERGREERGRMERGRRERGREERGRKSRRRSGEEERGREGEEERGRGGGREKRREERGSRIGRLFNMETYLYRSLLPSQMATCGSDTFSYLMNSPIGFKLWCHFPNHLAAGLPRVDSLGELCISHGNVQYFSPENILWKVGDGGEERRQPR